MNTQITIDATLLQHAFQCTATPGRQGCAMSDAILLDTNIASLLFKKKDTRYAGLKEVFFPVPALHAEHQQGVEAYAPLPIQQEPGLRLLRKIKSGMAKK